MRTLSFVQVPRTSATRAYAVPPAATYEAWFEADQALNPTNHRRAGEVAIGPGQLRRIAQLRRAGDSWAEVGRCVGASPGGAKNAYARLPDHLR